jgi:hypothetical protein
MGAKGRISGFIDCKSIVELAFLDLFLMSTLEAGKPLNYQRRLFYAFMLILWIFNNN